MRTAGDINALDGDVDVFAGFVFGGWRCGGCCWAVGVVAAAAAIVSSASLALVGELGGEDLPAVGGGGIWCGQGLGVCATAGLAPELVVVLVVALVDGFVDA